MWFLSLNSVYFSLRESFKSVPVSTKGSMWSTRLPSMHGGYSTCLQIARRTALSRTAYGTLQSQCEQTKIRENPNSNSIWFTYPGAFSFGRLFLLGSHRLVGQHGDSGMSCDGVMVTAMDLKGQGWGHTALLCVPPAQDLSTKMGDFPCCSETSLITVSATSCASAPGFGSRDINIALVWQGLTQWCRCNIFWRGNLLCLRCVFFFFFFWSFQAAFETVPKQILQWST